jgi:hypothetical protein
MEKEKLREIFNKLNELPILEVRMGKLIHQIHEAEVSVKQLKYKYNSESLDVEKLLKESFSAKFFQFIGKYEGKLTKEKQEELAAKLEYDKACARVDQLYAEREELSVRINTLKNDELLYRNELERRREEIIRNANSEGYMSYKKLEDRISAFSRQNIEINEALRAADKTIDIVKGAEDNLKSAEGWATYDVWVKGGIFSHMAKYDSIDSAEAAFGLLEDQLKNLHKELTDVNIQVSSELIHIDSATRAIDFWFDNIFTDLNVRSMIQENLEKLNELYEQINAVKRTLEQSKINIHKELDKLEKEKDELLIG